MTRKQDGKASVPTWYRGWITNRYGKSTMGRLDDAGAKHDVEISTLGWGKANSNMRYRMKILALPYWGIRLPVSVGIAIYRRLPQFLKNIYHEKNMIKILQTKMKGWLTNVSFATIIAQLMAAQADLIPAFIEASKQEVNWASFSGLLAGLAGAIWGIYRRRTPAYKSA